MTTQADDPNREARLAAALENAPADAVPHRALADLRVEQGRLGEAIALSRRALQLDRESPVSYAHLGAMLMSARRPQAALDLFQQALAREPALIEARSALASALCALDRYEEALPHYRIAYRQQPANNDARYMEALAMLALGDYRNGWRKHEVRWYASLGASSRAVLDDPMWRGEPGIEGRTLLLHAEQGLGDTIQFVRYVPMVVALGARVVLSVPKSLAPLLDGRFGIDRLVPYGETLPPFDLHCSLMSLPRVFRTEVGTIPADVPYVTAAPDRVAAWADRLGPRDGRRRIALTWSGSKAVWNRAVALERLAPLLDRPDCVFHVAQTEISQADRDAMARWPALVDHSAELTDFGETAALLAGMDVVLSVDTALAHLAGAMGLAAWTMLPFGCDYRWMRHTPATPWYPTMRLFRQPAFDDWAGVVAAVNAALDGSAA